MSITSENGLALRQTGGTDAHRPGARLLSAVCAALSFSSFLGAFMSMATLGTGALPALIPGLLAAFTLPLIRKNGLAAIAAAAVLAAAAAFFAAFYSAASDGLLAFLNRLMAASELRQAYKYEMFAVATEPDALMRAIRLAAVPLGAVLGVCTGMLARRHRALCAGVLAVLFALGAAYLGVLPETGWCIFVCAAALLAMCTRAGLTPRTAVCAGLALCAVCLICVYALPAESSAAAELNERIRDGIAAQTAVYGDPSGSENETGQEREDNFQAVEKPDDDARQGMTLGTSLYPYLLIALIALVLFVPAVLSDRRKRRLEALHEGMDSEDNAVCIRAMFLCAMRWLRLGGIEALNAPFGEYAGQIERLLSPEMRTEFEGVLPLWQEAAYSTHTMQPEQREQMREFMTSVRSLVTERSGLAKRLLIKYVYTI